MSRWVIFRTLLIVGEGRDEEAFLNHIKQFPGVCRRGEKITIKNARGKGALHVIDWTARQMRNRAYDRVAVLLDTDKDWTPAAIKKAKANNIQVLVSEPCFEAMLLRVLGQKPQATRLKDQFAPFVNNEPGQPESYAKHFHFRHLIGTRTREATLDALLKLFGL